MADRDKKQQEAVRDLMNTVQQLQDQQARRRVALRLDESPYPDFEKVAAEYRLRDAWTLNEAACLLLSRHPDSELRDRPYWGMRQTLDACSGPGLSITLTEPNAPLRSKRLVAAEVLSWAQTKGFLPEAFAEPTPERTANRITMDLVVVKYFRTLS